MTRIPARPAGLATGFGAGMSGVATLLAGPHLGGTYARVLVVAIVLTAMTIVVQSGAGRLVRARNSSMLMVWLIAGAVFAHATEPGTGFGSALSGLVTLLPAAGLAIIAVWAASEGLTAPTARVPADSL